MQLICIQDSFCLTNPKTPCVKKGNIYTHVSTHVFMPLEGTNNNIWYKVAETGEPVHHSSLFIEADEDLVEKLVEHSIEN